MNKRNSDPHHRNPALTTGSLPLNNRKIHILWVEEGSIEGGGGEGNFAIYGIRFVDLFWKNFVKYFFSLFSEW